MAALAPAGCASCSVVLSTDALFCADCSISAALLTRTRQLDRTPAWACGSYTGPLAEAVKRFKFEDQPHLARRFAATLAALGLPPCTAGERITLVPVPLHPVRLAARGFNQSALLAQHLAHGGGHACTVRGLARTADTQHQTRLSRAERFRNLKGQFVARRSFAGEAVVLVDDVLTTGATALACVECLTDAGGQVAGVLTIAQTD